MSQLGQGVDDSSDNKSRSSLEDHNAHLSTPSSSTSYFQSTGVNRMEAVYRASQGSGGKTMMWALAGSVLVCAWAYSLDTSTTSNYEPFVTSSFEEHSNLSALAVATKIISSVCKPFLAKLSDVTSRPYTYILVVLLYVLGYIIIATCTNFSAYVVGSVFAAIAGAGLDLLNDIIVGDLTTLEWRGFVSSMLSMPFVINTWFAGEIVQALSDGDGWRWGYGMFAIIMPVVIGPAILTLIYLERKAHKLGIVNMASSNAARREARALAEKKGEEGPHGLVIAEAAPTNLAWKDRMKANLTEIDAFGLILLGFGWSLLLLPFSLKAYAKNGWKNPSMIAMMVVGGVILIIFVLYERYFAAKPITPRRLLLNKTFMCAAGIDFFYFMAGQLRGLYFSSFIYIVEQWSVRNWTYFNNTMTLCLCIFGVIAGLIFRWTHRYKALQIIGLCIKIIGVGILLSGKKATQSTAAFAMSQVLIGAGGAFSVVGSRVASQASVPHQDLALSISLLSLFTGIGSAVGSALAAVIWTDKMPGLLRQHLPSSVTDRQVTTFFGNIRTIRTYPMSSPIRTGAIEAYRETLWYLVVPALCISFIPLFLGMLQTNYYLGKQQNAVMNVTPGGEKVEGVDTGLEQREEKEARKTFKEKFLKFWAGK
ncbi:MFS general substrate transporter [Marasmius fiardii PR-910]|nr:MFS general substrate transporter [Marasmius fiardii PR-910]